MDGRYAPVHAPVTPNVAPASGRGAGGWHDELLNALAMRGC